jgi:hypothetical protein
MGSVSAPALATALSGDAVHEAVVLLQRYTVEVTRALEEVLGAGATGNIDVGLLIAIHARPRLSPAEAGSVVGSPRSTVARGLARLVRSGLVERAGRVPTTGAARSSCSRDAADAASTG